MNETDKQKYLELVISLINCKDGGEEDIVKSYPELINTKLVAILRDSAYLWSQENDLIAEAMTERITILANYIEQLLLLNTKSDFGDLLSELDLLKILVESINERVDLKIVDELLQDQQHLLNDQMISAIKIWFKNISDESIENRELMAEVIGDIGSLIQESNWGDRETNIEIAITAYDTALAIKDWGNSQVKWASIQNNRAIAYYDRMIGNKADNIEIAITGYDNVLKVRNQQKPSTDWAETQKNRAIAYNSRIKGEKAENIEMAIAGYDAALSTYTKQRFPTDWAEIQNSRAIAYNDRIRGGKAENIEMAITGYDAALSIYTKQKFPTDWAIINSNLASAYNDRIEGNRIDNIEKAIIHCHAALEIHTQQGFPIDWAMIQANLAISYSNRVLGDRAENLEIAIFGYNAVLEIINEQDHSTVRASTKNNLANTYLKRIRGDRSENLELAIDNYNTASIVKNKLNYPIDWAMIQNNLGNVYAERIKGKKIENIDLAIDYYKKSLEVYYQQKSLIDWAMVQSNLAVAYTKRLEGDKAENIELAISSYNFSLLEYTKNSFPIRRAATQNNLAAAYSRRKKGDENENTRIAINNYKSALGTYTELALPDDCRRTARNLGNLYFQEKQWKSASTTYLAAISASDSLYQFSILLDSKADELKETADLPRRMAYTLARTDELQKAVEVLEQNRARGLSESLDRDRANLTQLQQINNELYEKYRDITNQLRNIEAQQRDRITSTERHSLTPETMRDNATHLRQQLDDLIQAIRQVQGYENFLALPTFADVRHAISQIDRPLIYLLCTSAGSLALIVTPENINTVWCNNFTETQLATLIETWFTAYNQRQNNRLEWLNTIDTVTHQLWEPLMAPLLDQLTQQQIDRAVLIPTGYLSLLPLHAAWTEDPHAPSGRQYVIDRIHFTYAPNAKSLTAAQAIATNTTGNAILAIDNPTQDLPNAQREIQQVTSYFEQPKILQGATAQAATVLDQLPNYQYIHLACHGTADLNEPLKSGLQMSDRLLSLKEFLALKLGEDNSSGIRLAVLSACETALPGTENTDEAISLPTGLLQAGVAGIIASLWAVDDSRTMLLLTKFYELWQGAAALPIDVALYQSQLWLRNITEKDLAALIGQRTLTPEKYQHLYYWAAFSYTGI
jgi:CHAT domain-containing protein